MINEKLNEALNEIVGKLFSLNRLFDRACSVLSVKHKAITSAKIIHSTLAHFFPIFADSITEYQQSRNMLSRYPSTQEGNEMYESPIQFYEIALEEMSRFEDMVEDALDSAVTGDIRDHSTKSFLNGILKSWNPYLETMNNIVDICKNYGNDLKSQMQFDDEIEHCFVVPIVGDN